MSCRTPNGVNLGKRDQIVSSAVELFARDGFYHITLREVATHAGCWLGSVSHFFPEKDRLYNAAVAEAARRCQADMASALAKPGSPEKQLRRFCLKVLEGYIHGKPHFALIDRANSELSNSNFPLIIQEQFDEIHAALAGIICKIIPNGDELPLRWLVSYFVGSIYGAGKLHRQHLVLLKLQNPKAMARFLDGLIAYVMAGLISPT
jgi:AcrR family transcriptional regulator